MWTEPLLPVMALLIPIISVTVSLGALIVWIVVWYRRRMREIDCRHKERMAAIEKGLELLPEPVAQPEQMAPRSRYLLWLRNRSEEHTSALQSHVNIVCRRLLETKKHR